MSIFWVKPKGQGAGNKSGTSLANAIDGTKALAMLINNGTVKGGDDVYFVGGYTRAELIDWPCPRAVSERLHVNNPSDGGIFFGTSQGANSAASGIRFHWSTPEGQSVWDMSGATDPTERMVAAIYLRGEDITLIKPHIKPGTWNYIFGPGLATRIAGVSASTDAENRSDENNGIVLLGNGNVIDGGVVDGTGHSSKFCRFGVYKCPSHMNVSTASSHKTGITRDMIIKGVASGGICQPFGGGTSTAGDMYDMKPGTRERFHSLTISDGAWGHEPGYLSSGAGNAARHGNAFGIAGRFFGGAEIFDCDVSGGYQDGLACGVAAGAVIRDNVIHDLNQPSVDWWVWSPVKSQWELQGVSNNIEGNGIKTGLLRKDGGSPTTWLGLDGVVPSPGDNLRVSEMRNIVLRNRILRVNGSGITTNMSRGCVYHANEIDGTGGAGILLVSMSGQNASNIWISHNFVRRTGLAYSYQSDCLRIESQYRVWLYNNILWSDPRTTMYDLYHGTSLALNAAGNLLVTGRTRGNPYPGSSDLPPQTPAWTPGAGLSSNSPLRGAGSPLAFGARTYGVTRNLHKALFKLDAPNVGPY